MRDCELVKISPHNFELICAQHPKVALALMRSIARRSHQRRSAPQGARAMTWEPEARESRERQAAHSLTANLATLAVIPANPESEDSTGALVRRVGDELRKFGCVGHSQSPLSFSVCLGSLLCDSRRDSSCLSLFLV